MLLGCPKQNVYHRSEKLKVINTTLFLFYAIIYYQFKTSELKNGVEEVVEQAVQALNVVLEWTWNVGRWSMKVKFGP